jgi:hypothetical protein
MRASLFSAQRLHRLDGGGTPKRPAAPIKSEIRPKQPTSIKGNILARDSERARTEVVQQSPLALRHHKSVLSSCRSNRGKSFHG